MIDESAVGTRGPLKPTFGLSGDVQLFQIIANAMICGVESLP